MLVLPVEFLRLHRDSPVLVRTGHGILVMDHQTPSASLQIDQMSALLALAYLAVEAVTPTNWNYLNWQVFLSSFIQKWVFHVVASLLQIRSASDAAQTLSWHSLAVVRGSYGPEDSINDVAEIKFDRPVPIKVCELTFFPPHSPVRFSSSLYQQENTRYTFRLRNQGGKTHNGDGGVLSIKGPDGTTFNFSACLLSFNGTNHIRGQLPYILYCK